MAAMAPADTPSDARAALRVFVRHASPRLLLGAFAALAAARVWLGGWSRWDLVPVAAIALLWPFQEWLIHVFVLHARPKRIGRFAFDARVARKHRAHHGDPWNYEILFIPFHAFSYGLPLLALLGFALTHDPQRARPALERALTALATCLLLAIHYEAVHFLIHTRVAPRGAYYRSLWRNHRLHHFKNEHHWFGVTRLEADRVLGTAPVADGVPASPTAR